MKIKKKIKQKVQIKLIFDEWQMQKLEKRLEFSIILQVVSFEKNLKHR